MKRVLDWLRRQDGGAPRCAFRCNICGASNRALRSAFGRELPSCKRCGSTVRMRSIVHVLSTEMFGRSLKIREFPRRRDLIGLGMSDSGAYAKRLARRLGYTNTYFDSEPRFDICRPMPAQFGTLDFMISTDVFEHVVPPVQAAFDHARRMLKPGASSSSPFPSIGKAARSSTSPTFTTTGSRRVRIAGCW